MVELSNFPELKGIYKSLDGVNLIPTRTAEPDPDGLKLGNAEPLVWYVVRTSKDIPDKHYKITLSEWEALLKDDKQRGIEPITPMFSSAALKSRMVALKADVKIKETTKKKEEVKKKK